MESSKLNRVYLEAKKAWAGGLKLYIKCIHLLFPASLPLPLLFARLAVSDPVRATAVEPLFNLSANSTSELYNAFNLLNVTVGGRLHTALPFERACFSIVEGKHVNVSEAACATLQANYTNPVYRVEHFGAYMLVRTKASS